MSALADPPVVATAVSRRSRRGRRMTGSLVVGMGLLAFIVLVAVLGPILSRYGAEQIIASDSLAHPGSAHWLGADNFGRDVFVRVADGYRISLVVALGSVAIGLLVGIPLGLLAGSAGDLVDNLVMRPLDVLMAFPAVLLAITVTAIFGAGMTVLILAIGVIYIPIIARVMRASTLETSRELYVEAARSRGASSRRVLLRHVLPNSLGPVIVQASILMGVAMLLEAAMSFIGLGVRPPTPSLGLMLSEGRDFMSSASWVVAAPGVAIMVLVLAFNLIGDGLQDWLNPRGGTPVR
jgi:peptide/nickel transport system permease protein